MNPTAIPFTDAHVHFWDHGVAGLRWRFLEPDFDHPRLKGTHRLDAPRYTPGELREEAGELAPSQVVHIQCAAPTKNPAEETAWLHRLADDDAWPNAVVAGCRLREDDAPAVIVDNARWPRFRGVRDLTVSDAVTTSEVSAAFCAAAAIGASVELMMPTEHYDTIAALSERWPTVTIVLGHAGLPLERSAAAVDRWSDALRHLAASTDQVVVKVSAIASSADPAWTTDSIRPLVLAAIDAFGAQRSMLGTNWPIDRLYGSYTRLVGAYRSIVAELPLADQHALLHGTAERVYQI